MSLDGLNRRIDKLIAAIDQQSPGNQVLELPTHLLSTGEQAHFTAFLNVIEGRLYHDNHLDLRDLSNEELVTAKLWVQLLKALDSEDVAAAAKYRQELAVAA